MATSGSGVEGVAGAEEEAAAVFFMGIGGTGETARGPTGLVDDGPALAVLLALLAGTVAAGSLANWCDATPLMPPIATAAKAAFMAKFPTVMPIG